jgi:hypothetical protein
MRILLAVATILLLSSSAVPLFAQDEEKPPAFNQPQSTPVQPERTPQQSEQSRDQDRQRAEDTRVGRDWRTQQRGGDNMGRMGQSDMGQMRERMDRDRDGDHRTVGRNWQMHRELAAMYRPCYLDSHASSH